MIKRYNIDENAVILDAFRSNNDRIIGKYYAGLKTEFQKNIAFRFSYLPSEYLDDVYQDSFIELGEKISSGELNDSTLTVPVGAYLNGIGHKIAHEYINKYGFAPVEGRDEDADIPDTSTDDESPFTPEDKDLITEYVDKMGEPCTSVLRKFYFEDYTMFSIAWMLKYKTEDVAKSRKNKCMSQLKDAIKKGLYGKFDIDGEN